MSVNKPVGVLEDTVLENEPVDTTMEDEDHVKQATDPTTINCASCQHGSLKSPVCGHYNNLMNENGKLKSQLHNSEKQITEYKSKLESQSEEVQRLQAALIEKENHISQATHALATVDMHLNAMEAGTGPHHYRKVDRNSRLAEIQQKFSVLRSSVLALRKKLTGSAKEVERADAEIRTLKAEIEEIKNDSQDIRLKADNLWLSYFHHTAPQLLNLEEVVNMLRREHAEELSGLQQQINNYLALLESIHIRLGCTFDEDGNHLQSSECYLSLSQPPE